jgi:hypothetical protein
MKLSERAEQMCKRLCCEVVVCVLLAYEGVKQSLAQRSDGDFYANTRRPVTLIASKMVEIIAKNSDRPLPLLRSDRRKEQCCSHRRAKYNQTMPVFTTRLLSPRSMP